MPDGIQTGGSILAQQMKPKGFQYGATPGPTYGGGTSPVRTFDTILPPQFGMLAMWSGDGTIAVTDQDYPTEAPADGIVYGRNGLLGEWIPVPSGGGIPEAPSTGLTYTRTGSPTGPGSWTALPFIISEAPNDGQAYNRNGVNHAWIAAFNQQAANALYAPIGTISFPEAPEDGIAYARRGWDHTWQPVATGTGVPEAPPTGQTYTRDGLHQEWIGAFTLTQATQFFAPISTVSFPEAPTDGNNYTRNGALRTWQPAFSQVQANLLYAPVWTVSFPEAPTDGRSYARRGVDNSWQAIAVTTPGIPEAPATGSLYVRDGSPPGWIDIQTVTLDGGVF